MVSSTTWCHPPGTLALTSNEVHVWRAALDLNVADFERLERSLAPDERARAARFRFSEDRQHFIATHGILRSILARYLDRESAQLQFRYAPSGKPCLALEFEADGICFNLSHCHGLALYALACNREVGVDLEWIQMNFAWEQIAERFFSSREVAALRSLPAVSKPEAFFGCWACKEAYLKARGEGLSVRLDQFTVSLAPDEPAALLSTDGDPQEAARWSIQQLTPGVGYVGAVAAEGHDWRLRCWQRD